MTGLTSTALDLRVIDMQIAAARNTYLRCVHTGHDDLAADAAARVDELLDQRLRLTWQEKR